MCTFPLWKSYYSNDCFTDHTSDYSDDLDTDDLTSLLTGWEDGSSDPGLKAPVQPDSHEKLNSAPVTVGVSTERRNEPPPCGPPSLDIEADITDGEAINGQ